MPKRRTIMQRAQEVTLVPVDTVLPSARRLLMLPAELTQERLLAHADAQYQTGTAATASLAATMALLRVTHGPQGYRPWLAACTTRFGYAKRTADRMLRAGACLLRHVSACPALATISDLQKLEELARLSPSQLAGFMASHGDAVNIMPRTAVQQWVRNALGLVPRELPPAVEPEAPAEDKPPRDPLKALAQFDPAHLVPAVEGQYALVYLRRFVAACQARPDIAPGGTMAAYAQLAQAAIADFSALSKGKGRG